MRIVHFNAIALISWLELFRQGLRLKNPKITDLGPLKKQAKDAKSAVLPPEFQSDRDNIFSHLIRSVESLDRGDTPSRQDIIDQTRVCLEYLLKTRLFDPEDRIFMRGLMKSDYDEFIRMASTAQWKYLGGYSKRQGRDIYG